MKEKEKGCVDSIKQQIAKLRLRIVRIVVQSNHFITKTRELFHELQQKASCIREKVKYYIILYNFVSSIIQFENCLNNNNKYLSVFCFQHENLSDWIISLRKDVVNYKIYRMTLNLIRQVLVPSRKSQKTTDNECFFKKILTSVTLCVCKLGVV